MNSHNHTPSTASDVTSAVSAGCERVVLGSAWVEIYRQRLASARATQRRWQSRLNYDPGS